MKLLIAGARDKSINDKGFHYLDNLHLDHNFDTLVNGMANGIDKSAREWAAWNHIEIKSFPANWNDISQCLPYQIKINKFGRKYNIHAGFQRNLDMAIEMQWEPDNIAVIFPGGNGSKDMLGRCKEFFIETIDLMDRKDLIDE